MLPPKDSTPFWKFLHSLVTLLRLWAGGLHIEGRENVPMQGGAILACNHPGGVDVIVLGYSSPRQVYYMAKEELFKIHPALSWLLFSVGAFPVRRGRNDVGAIATSVAIVKQGKILGMFPEGTRDRDRGLTRGRSGAVRIALATGAPIVPCALIGMGKFNRQWKNPLRRPKATLRFGKPIYFNKAEGSNAPYLQKHTDTVMFAIAEMLPLELRGIYADPALLESAEGDSSQPQ
ncbi:MAG: 1-acyl-sn-glycerol-3-phosphate acyltransferase [Caldilineaceae bacterium]|nr:1-acyl-sn-glycerol-3-phosphate acyltransferase [Caldilineaceae bacterium]